ncbi:MAG: DUF5050 domain-containing protein [Firmicutes bacterium]|nr:DUF5050 domain-containing protein [Bacillota bacterium]MBQ9605530.1 DUF5050 domain-containing protein [Bacillota bacterium]
MKKFLKAFILAALVGSLFTGCGDVHDGDGSERPDGGNASAAAASTGGGNTVGNLVNYGSAAEYVRTDGSESEFEGLYCQYGEKGEKFAKVTPEGELIILKETQPYFINVRNDKVYYADAGDNFRLYTMDIDGSDDKPMTEGSAYYVNLWEDYIYYADPQNDYHLYRIPIEGGDPELISADNCQYVNVADDYIYYTNFSQGGTIYRCEHNGENPVMMNRMQSMYPNVQGKYIYYSEWDMTGQNENDKRLTRLDLETGETETLNNCQSGDINIYKNKIYYTDWDSNTIRRMDLDGSNDEVYDESYGTYINIAGGKMFCVHYAEGTKEISLNITNLKEEDK